MIAPGRSRNEGDEPGGADRRGRLEGGRRVDQAGRVDVQDAEVELAATIRQTASAVSGR